METKIKIKVPKHLNKEGKKLYKAVLEEFELQSHEQAILTQACECLDRIYQAREVIQKNDSAFYNDRFGKPKVHPALETEKKFKTLFYRLLRELGLSLEDTSRVNPLY